MSGTGQSGPQPPSNPIVGLVDLIPGGAELLSFLDTLRADIPAISVGITQGIIANPMGSFQKILAKAAQFEQAIEMLPADIFDLTSQITFGTGFRAYLEYALGVMPDQLDEQAKRSADVMDRMLGFAFALPYVLGSIAGVGKLVLAGRWSDALTESLKDIPQEMGLSWAMGLIVEKGFDAALGEALYEGIRKQLRPNQPEWPVVRTMLRQHVATPEFLTERLRAAGYPENTIQQILKLADAQIPVGDIEQLVLHGIIGKAEAKDRISELGFSKDVKTGQSVSDLDALYTLYVDKAETEASRTYVSTARALFRQQLITEADYRAILTSLNFPVMEIDDDVAAIVLEHSVGRLQTGVSTIKSEYNHHTIDDRQAILELQAYGYGAAQASELVATWKLGPVPRVHGLSQAKILSYLLSGVISPQDAQSKLAATGLDPADVALLIAHPQAQSGVRVHALTPGLVITAYMDGAIQQQDIAALLQKAGVDPNYVNYYEQIALFRKSRQKGPGTGNNPLSAAEIIDAWRYGLLDQHTAQIYLEQIGYSAANALLLMEIKNKGPIQAPSPPVFSSLQAAVQYLIAAGFTVYPPPDPNIAAAEAMLSQAGYTWTTPSVGPIALH